MECFATPLVGIESDNPSWNPGMIILESSVLVIDYAGGTRCYSEVKSVTEGLKPAGCI